tara:strand:+ start:343 stop:546 length:204 start_codon:yes stop_codon:yes gene_type:complete
MTAVEWLVDQMRQRKEQGLTLSFYDLEMFASYAKEMEKEQIINAYDENKMGRVNYGEQYYNTTFKSE